MIQMTFMLNSQEFSEVRVGFERYVAFSGTGSGRNNPASATVRDVGPLPPGKYYVVDRPTGGHLGTIRDALRGKSEWFALYREDGLIDDQTIWQGVLRGEFRLHPVGPARLSKGCITLQYEDQFSKLRARLLNGLTSRVPGTHHRAYATVDVMALGPAPDSLEPAPSRRERFA